MTPTLVFRLLLVVFIISVLDWYVFQSIKAVFSRWSDKAKYIGYIVYWSISLGLLLWIFITLITFNGQKSPSPQVSRLMAVLVLFTVPKLIIFAVLVFEDVFRAMKYIIEWVTVKVSSSSEPVELDSRRRFISQVALTLASIPFVSILYGVTKGKYNYKVINETLSFPDLPKEFDGFKIVQISDIHVGSFDNMDEVRHGIELIKSQGADLFLFTGDIVNNRAEEFDGWHELFSEIKAPYGQFSVLGNHDYGDYVPWNTIGDKIKNFDGVKKIHSDIGYRLLLNESVAIKKDGAEIHLVGVENWGLPPFPQKGNLKKATEGLDKNSFKILMSHDPSHWDAQVKDHEHKFNLTLSGHTHGMQFGVELGNVKWSPVKYKYPKWAGLYSEGNKHLYVNRGFGYIGFPGRVGIWPEITVITLRQA